MADSLLNPEPLPPPNPWPVRITIAVVVLGLVGLVVYSRFRYYGEEKLVREFMDTLVAGHYQNAYQIWNPTEAYSYQAFLEDWGETTSFGRVRSYEIVQIKPTSGVILQVPIEGGERQRNLRVRGASSGVIISVRINGLEPPARLWVETNPPRLAFPPY